jgi:pyruvate,orthophosphate dikinase
MTTETAALPEIVAFGNGTLAARPSGVTDAARIGGKGAHLVDMADAGLPVPPGFVLPIALCQRYQAEGPAVLAAAMAGVDQHMRQLEASLGRGFGSARRPLLVSVRSGAAVSMPGMLETLLNIGLDRQALGGLIRTTGDARFAWDCRRRLIRQFAEVVHGAPAVPFDELVGVALRDADVDNPRDLDFAGQEALAEAFSRHFRAFAGSDFPEDPRCQLRAAIEAVLRSWTSGKARAYRRSVGLDDAGGTAVIVQAMVYGNAGTNSGAGVAFTRDPDSGAPGLYADFCAGGQGEDVVSGRVTTAGAGVLERGLPAVWDELGHLGRRLEALFHDMQDLEFTVERGRLWLLQTRSGWRSPRAALRIAVDLVAEGLIDEATALDRLADIDPAVLRRQRLCLGPDDQPLAYATPAGSGCAAGAAAFDVDGVRRLVAAGRPAILVRSDIATADIEGLRLAQGVVAAAGSRTAHAAVVARAMGKVCLVGCAQLRIAGNGKSAGFGEVTIGEGEGLSLDGDSGAVYGGLLPMRGEPPPPELAIVEGWARRRHSRGAVAARG